MALVQFAIPGMILPLLDAYNCVKVVNAVQSELNSGVRLSGGMATLDSWKSLKEDGKTRLVIISKTKAGEKLQLENTIGSRFYAWCNATMIQQTFAETTVVLPDCFVSWLDKFAKK